MRPGRLVVRRRGGPAASAGVRSPPRPGAPAGRGLCTPDGRQRHAVLAGPRLLRGFRCPWVRLRCDRLEVRLRRGAAQPRLQSGRAAPRGCAISLPHSSQDESADAHGAPSACISPQRGEARSALSSPTGVPCRSRLRLPVGQLPHALDERAVVSRRVEQRLRRSRVRSRRGRRARPTRRPPR